MSAPRKAIARELTVSSSRKTQPDKMILDVLETDKISANMLFLVKSGLSSSSSVIENLDVLCGLWTGSDVTSSSPQQKSVVSRPLKIILVDS